MATNDRIDVTDILFPEDPLDTLRVTASGDVQLTSGTTNFRGAIRRRGMTSQGHMVHRAGYGMDLLNMLESPRTPAAKATMANNAKRNTLDDPRTLDASATVSDLAGSSGVEVSVKVRIRGQQLTETINFALE